MNGVGDTMAEMKWDAIASIAIAGVQSVIAIVALIIAVHMLRDVSRTRGEIDTLRRELTALRARHELINIFAHRVHDLSHYLSRSSNMMWPAVEQLLSDNVNRKAMVREQAEFEVQRGRLLRELSLFSSTGQEFSEHAHYLANGVGTHETLQVFDVLAEFLGEQEAHTAEQCHAILYKRLHGRVAFGIRQINKRLKSLSSG